MGRLELLEKKTPSSTSVTPAALPSFPRFPRHSGRLMLANSPSPMPQTTIARDKNRPPYATFTPSSPRFGYASAR